MAGERAIDEAEREMDRSSQPASGGGGRPAGAVGLGRVINGRRGVGGWVGPCLHTRSVAVGRAAVDGCARC
jgi:hypothetical protein